jgi:hypothetical protein
MLTKLHISLFFWIGIILSGCSLSKITSRDLRLESNYCTPAMDYSYDSIYKPLPTAEIYKSRLMKKFSFSTLLTANAVGILKDWEKLDSLKTVHLSNKSAENASIYLYNKQLILSKIFITSIEINSIAAELDCEGERAQELADYLSELETKKVKTLTVLSIITGAITGTVTATATGTGNSKGKEIIGISGGILSATLGILTLFSNKRVQYSHDRNLLTEIWNESPKSNYYPPSLWYKMNEPLFSNSKQWTINHNIKIRWEKLGDLSGGSKKKNKEVLYFGKGGWYDKDNLRTRASMLDQVQAAVKLFNQDLQSLILNINDE